MIVALDVQYGVTAVTTAAVGWHAWPDATAALERIARHATPPAPYVPGAFVERELPYLLAALADVPAPIATIVIDCHVWLGPELPGLGAHLHSRVAIPVIGVARSGDAVAFPVTRLGYHHLVNTTLGPVPIVGTY